MISNKIQSMRAYIVDQIYQNYTDIANGNNAPGLVLPERNNFLEHIYNRENEGVLHLRDIYDNPAFYNDYLDSPWGISRHEEIPLYYIYCCLYELNTLKSAFATESNKVCTIPNYTSRLDLLSLFQSRNYRDLKKYFTDFKFFPINMAYGDGTIADSRTIINAGLFNVKSDKPLNYDGSKFLNSVISSSSSMSGCQFIDTEITVNSVVSIIGTSFYKCNIIGNGTLKFQEDLSNTKVQLFFSRTTIAQSITVLDINGEIDIAILS